MFVKLVLALTVFCAVISQIKTDKSYDGRPFMQGYTRIKRGKYYSSPHRFYSRPPVSHPIKGIYSYTPPPNYKADDNEQQFPGPPSQPRPQVSKRPTNDGLGEEDINNIVKYLSKQDLDKIIDLAGGKGRDKEYSQDSFEKYNDKSPFDKYNDKGFFEKYNDKSSFDKYNDNGPIEKYNDKGPFEKYNEKSDIDKYNDDGPFEKYNDKGSFKRYTDNSKPPKTELKTTHSFHDFDLEKYSSKSSGDESSLFKTLVQEIDVDPTFSVINEEPKQYKVEYSEPKQLKVEYSKPATNQKQPTVNFVTQPTPPETYFSNFQNNNNPYDTAALAAEESMLKRQIAYLQSQINDGVVYTDSKAIPEETLPKPMNLREEHDYDVSFTNNVPTVVKAEQSSSYKVENFGDLPLMNYNSKLDTLSSYHVPHYTVTSASKQPAPASFPPPSPYGVKAPPVEPAPPSSVAKSQSDAHLKAVRIWSHRSKGTAYTLHDDGSLSLEKPGRPKGSYGYP